MAKDNLIICVSSFNNYDMLEHEVLKNINFEDFEFINIDDKSMQSEIEKGKRICNQNNIKFIENNKKGIQYSVDTLMKYIQENKPNCEWIIIHQHDNYPVTKNFYTRFSKLIEKNDLSDISMFGFNHLDPGDYTGNAFTKWQQGTNPIGLIGKLHLSVENNPTRWAVASKNPVFKQYPERFAKPFSIEIPLECTLAIKVQDWNDIIQPTTDYEFHIAFPDICMQFLYNNKHIVALPNLYCFNHQELKTKYGMHKSSAHGAKSGQEIYFGKYSNFTAWKKRWGWEYENTRQNFPYEHYKDTLIGKLFKYDFLKEKMPYKIFNIEY